MTNRELELFGNASSLEQFIQEYEKKFEALTAIEIKVLTLLAKEIECSVISKKLALSHEDVLGKKLSIRKKLSIGSKTDYIKYALAFGLISF